jgi:RNA polymerase-binding transcription factor DksA
MLRGRILDSVDEILHHHDLCLSTTDGEVDTAQIQSWEISLAEVLSASERNDIARLAVALDRIDAGTYALCAECCDQIGIMRLVENPMTDLCESCETGAAWRPMHGL